MTHGKDTAPPSLAPRQAASQLALVLLAIAAAWLASRFWLYPWLGMPDNAPLILRPILGFVVAWWLLRRSGSGWASLGLRAAPNLPRLLLASALLYASVWLVATQLVPLLARYFSATGGPVFLAYIRGNGLAFAGWLGIAWLVGGFMEELLFRGFLMHRVQSLLGGGRAAIVVAILAQAALFGALHLHQGTLGFVFAGSLGVLYGLAYQLFGRNLWPLVLVHGLWNSLAIASLYGW